MYRVVDDWSCWLQNMLPKVKWYLERLPVTALSFSQGGKAKRFVKLVVQFLGCLGDAGGTQRGGKTRNIPREKGAE